MSEKYLRISFLHAKWYMPLAFHMQKANVDHHDLDVEQEKWFTCLYVHFFFL